MLPIAKSTLSQHLKELKEAGLIQGEIEAPKIKYCFKPETIGRKLNNWLKRYSICNFFYYFTFVILRTTNQIHNYMNIKILGTGCSKCKTLEKLTRDAVTEMGLSADIEKVEDIMKIMNYGVMQHAGPGSERKRSSSADVCLHLLR
ncbi:MAG: MTH895/ArsE family thioredoxin-like protein [Ignavibacteriales bacterium]|nr:MTH895/ArsE family thioredoxin-like protein [Ignavibacteriales bacterium]